MLISNCQHEWKKHTDAGRVWDEGIIQATFICYKCHSILTAAEVFQLEALQNQTESLKNQTKLAKHQLGFQKWLSLVAFVVSVTATIVALLK